MHHRPSAFSGRLTVHAEASLDGNFEIETGMKIIAIMAVMFACFAINAKAIDINNVECFTDRKEYVQGENVIINVKNNSKDDVLIVNRDVIDGGFAIIEIKCKDDKCKAIELISAANITTFKTLKNGDSHIYIWKTKGYNRSDTLAVPGVYRVILNIDGLAKSPTSALCCISQSFNVR